MISLVFLGCLALSAAAPQYQPFQFKTAAVPDYSVASNSNDGQYHPDESGAYKPDGAGAYVHSDNPYKYQNVAPVNYAGVVGRYNSEIENSGQYKPDNSGAYNINDGQYHPDSSGAYNPDGSGSYTHSDQPYKNQGGVYVGGNTGASAVGSYKPVVTKPVTVTPLKGNAPVKDNNNYKYDNNNFGIIRKIEQVLEDGYHYIYETENGILGEEEGHLANKGQKDEYMDVKGFYRYIGPDNVEYKVEYTVDAVNGFVARGDHLPQLPRVSS